ncbi:hypothetical protein AAMO2058_001252600 [Amorphochlora amoebiformis]
MYMFYSKHLNEKNKKKNSISIPKKEKQYSKKKKEKHSFFKKKKKDGKKLREGVHTSFYHMLKTHFHIHMCNIHITTTLLCAIQLYITKYSYVLKTDIDFSLLSKLIYNTTSNSVFLL